MLSLIRSAAIDDTAVIRETHSLIVDEDPLGDLLQSLCTLARSMCSANLLPGMSDRTG